MRDRVRFWLRVWWPMLGLVALGLVSAELLRRGHIHSQAILQRTIASLDNISESRRRLITAYLIHERQASGDATFDRSSALAELRSAEYALRNWRDGRSGIVDLPSSLPTDSGLIAIADAYQAALAGFHVALTAEPRDAVSLRTAFSEADRAAGGLELAIHEAVRGAVRAAQRSFRVRLAGWALLLLVTVVVAVLARRALRESEARRAHMEERLARLRVLAPVGIVECDPVGRVVVANPMWCTLTGQSEGAWAGRPWWEALAEGDREGARVLWAADRGASALTTEVRLETRQSGADPVWLLVRIGQAAAGETAGRRVATFTDITQQRRIEDQLHHAQKMEAVGRLAGGVAHDFNNLLTSIRGFATLALEAARGNAGLEEDLREVERAAVRGHALTRQLLTFSRQDRIEPALVDATGVVRGLRRMLERLVGSGVELEAALGDAPATVLIDPHQLEQVLTNLVINASDAMERRGRIRIGVQPIRIEGSLEGEKGAIPGGDYVMLSVGDTGPGIPTAVRDRIFEPFFTTKERGKGTGLGLSTVWAIVRQGGGHVHVYSEEGQGTVFKIFLPRVDGKAPASETGPRPVPVAATPAGTVLVVEDEEALRRLTSRVLELGGWTVIQAVNGDDALRIVAERQAPLDLIVTDLSMPGMGGAELVRHLRTRGIEVPTLFVSGFADHEVDLDGVHFLEKPFSPAALANAVASVLQGTRIGDGHLEDADG